MNIRRTRIFLGFMACAAFTGALGLLGYGFLAGSDIPSGDSEAKRHITATHPADLLPPLASFQAIKAIDLQRPLSDVNPSTSWPWRLVGTILDPGHSQAVFARADGHTEMKSAGESLAGAQVLAIEDGMATLSYNGQTLVLHVEKQP